MLGIAYTDTDAKARAYMDEFGITYLNAPDAGTRISDMYHIQGVPETFVIDKQGNIAQFIYAPTFLPTSAASGPSPRPSMP